MIYYLPIILVVFYLIVLAILSLKSFEEEYKNKLQIERKMKELIMRYNKKAP